MYIFLYPIACSPRLMPSSGRQRLAPGRPPRGYAAKMPNHVFICISPYPSVKGSLEDDVIIYKTESNTSAALSPNLHRHQKLQSVSRNPSTHPSHSSHNPRSFHSAIHAT